MIIEMISGFQIFLFSYFLVAGKFRLKKYSFSMSAPIPLQSKVIAEFGEGRLFTIAITSIVNKIEKMSTWLASFLLPISLRFCISKTPPKMVVKNMENPQIAFLE